MSKLKIEIQGLKEFLQDVRTQDRSFSQYDLEVSNAVMAFHYKLDKRTNEVFNLPYSLSEVLIGKSVQRERISKTFAKYGLQYRDKKILAGKFPFTVINSSSKSKAPVRTNNGNIKWVEGEWSKDVYVSIRRGKSEKLKRNGNFAYLRPQTKKQTEAIRVRQTNKTWNEFPTRNFAGNRQHTTESVFGPTASAMAAGVFDNDPLIQREFDKLGDRIGDIFANFYLGK